MYLVLKDYEGALRVYAIPTADGKYMMPDLHWYRWGGLCADFGPDASEGKLLAGGVLRCRDSEAADWGLEWTWQYSGENLGSRTDDMYVPKHCSEGRYVKFGMDC